MAPTQIGQTSLPFIIRTFGSFVYFNPKIALTMDFTKQVGRKGLKEEKETRRENIDEGIGLDWYLFAANY